MRGARRCAGGRWWRHCREPSWGTRCGFKEKKGRFGNQAAFIYLLCGRWEGFMAFLGRVEFLMSGTVSKEVLHRLH